MPTIRSLRRPCAQETPKIHYKRRVVEAAIGFLLGVGLLLAGVVSKVIFVGVGGFVVMLACAMWALTSWRHMGGAVAGRGCGREPRPRGRCAGPAPGTGGAARTGAARARRDRVHGAAGRALAPPPGGGAGKPAVPLGVRRERAWPAAPRLAQPAADHIHPAEHVERVRHRRPRRSQGGCGQGNGGAPGGQAARPAHGPPDRGHVAVELRRRHRGPGVAGPFLGEGDPLERFPLGGRESQRRAEPAGQRTRRFTGPAGDPVVGQVVAEFEPRGMGPAGVIGRPEPPAAPGEGPDGKWRRPRPPRAPRWRPARPTGGPASAGSGRHRCRRTAPSFGTAFRAPGAALGSGPGASADEVGCRGGGAGCPPAGRSTAGADAVGWPACPGAPVGVGSNRSQPAPAK